MRKNVYKVEMYVLVDDPAKLLEQARSDYASANAVQHVDVEGLTIDADEVIEDPEAAVMWYVDAGLPEGWWGDDPNVESVQCAANKIEKTDQNACRCQRRHAGHCLSCYGTGIEIRLFGRSMRSIGTNQLDRARALLQKQDG